MKFKSVLFTAFVFMALLLAAGRPAVAAGEASPNLEAWNSFIAALEKRDMKAIQPLLSKDVTPEFMQGIAEQVGSKLQTGIDALKKMKFVKEHRSAEDIVKLGFEVPKVGNLPQEYLWVVLKKDRDSYKILNFEPTQSLTFYRITFKPHLAQGQEMKKTALEIINVIKNRLVKMEFTNYSFEIAGDSIVLEISGIEALEVFKGFIVKTGSFALHRCYAADDAAIAEKKASLVELYEYPQFEKKDLKNYFVEKAPIASNANGGVKASKVTYSSLHVPQVQIDLDDRNKAALEKFSESAAGDKKEPVTVACVLDHKVISVFGVGDKISSGRIWAENITLVQTANMINALIGSGPLSAGIEITSVDKK